MPIQKTHPSNRTLVAREKILMSPLVMALPELREQQTIMAREETMQTLQKNIFSWAVWGNFGDAGETPHLNYQHYQTMSLLQWIAIPNTDPIGVELIKPEQGKTLSL